MCVGDVMRSSQSRTCVTSNPTIWRFPFRLYGGSSFLQNAGNSHILTSFDRCRYPAPALTPHLKPSCSLAVPLGEPYPAFSDWLWLAPVIVVIIFDIIIDDPRAVTLLDIVEACRTGVRKCRLLAYSESCWKNRSSLTPHLLLFEPEMCFPMSPYAIYFLLTTDVYGIHT